MSTTYPNLVQTTFPDAVDKKYNMQDVSSANLARVQAYEALISNGNISGAQQYLQNNPDLIPVCFNADKWNRHEHMIIALETFFKDEVQDYILNIVKDKGTYDSGTRYSKYNVVNYTNNGVTQYYMALKTVPAGSSNSPGGANAAQYWLTLTVKGERGESGVGLSYIGIWDQTVTYGADDCVSRGNGLYRSLILNNANNDPQTDNGTKWQKVFNVAASAGAITFTDSVTLQAWRATVESGLSSANDNITNLKNNTLTVYISNNGDNTNDGLSTETPFLNLSGVLNTYRNIKILTIKFMDGVYTDHYLLSGLPSIVITSNSEDKTKVTLTGGIECINCGLYINNITVNSTDYEGASILAKRSTGNITNCNLTAKSTNSCVRTFTSLVSVVDCTLTNGNCGVRAEDDSEVFVKGCTGSNLNMGYYAIDGSTIDYDSSNTLTATTLTQINKGIVRQEGVTPVEIGGTGGTTVLEAKTNLRLVWEELKPENTTYSQANPMGGNNDTVSINQALFNKIKNYSLFSAQISKPNSNTYDNVELIGVHSVDSGSGSKRITFNGVYGSYAINLTLRIINSSITIYLNVRYFNSPASNVADTEHWKLTRLFGCA